MQLAELYAILQISPLLMTIIALVAFKEQVGWRRWSVIVMGFCGVLLIIKPNAGGLNPWALLGVLAAFGAACWPAPIEWSGGHVSLRLGAVPA